ncbi:MAG: hypothetical protein J7M26_07975 [Armatimonadetes bacterium]|nr:hypothetical protein [Armatimonadota bacterium]
MKRLRIEDDDSSGLPRLRRLPDFSEAPHELIAALVAATQAVGRELSYADALGLTGAAFMLRFSAGGPAHLDACRGRERFLPETLAQLGFPEARVVTDPAGALNEVARDLAGGRAPIVLGCFPEAPWRAGLVTALLPEGLWAVLDCAGRVHSLAPRADALVLWGEPGEPRPVEALTPTTLLRRALSAWEGEGDEEGAGAWRRWIATVEQWPHLPQAELPALVAAHEFVYEVLVDARGAGALWLAIVAEQVEETAAAWVMRASQRLEEMVELLEGRHPAVGDPVALQAFATGDWRRELAERLAEAAELDLAAKHDLERALQAAYPPEDDIG